MYFHNRMSDPVYLHNRISDKGLPNISVTVSHITQSFSCSATFSLALILDIIMSKSGLKIGEGGTGGKFHELTPQEI